MLNNKINIVPYQTQFQAEIDVLMESISDEFLEPISVNNTISSFLPPDLYLVAIIENKVIGTICITKLDNENAVLRKMFLVKQYRGLGIAEQLLQRILNWAYENNLKTIFLGTMKQFIAAQKFYETHLFEKVKMELLPKNFPINPVDTIFYKKEII